MKSLQPHINCVIRDGDPLLKRINTPGAKITISGLLRSSVEQSGLELADNARVFELNPVRTLEIDGEVWTFDLNREETAVPDVKIRGQTRNSKCQT